MDADGISPVNCTRTAEGVQSAGHFGPDSVFVLSPRAGLTEELEARRRELVAYEDAFGFDAGGKAGDLAQLRRILNP